eukprot:scaffold9182_cov101-Amphora_coffeaeformis.AAC.2
MERGDQPELDVTMELGTDDIMKFQSMIGAVQWTVSLSRFDVAHAVMSLGRFRANPRQGHLERLRRLIGYMKKRRGGADVDAHQHDLGQDQDQPAFNRLWNNQYAALMELDMEDRVRGPKGREEGSRGLKEVKGAVVIVVASGAGRGDAGPHTGGNRGYRGSGLGDRSAGCCRVGAVGRGQGSGQIAGAGSRGDGGDGWRALGKVEGEGGSDWAEGFQAGVEGGERCSGGFDGDIAEAFALVLGGLLTVGSTEGG